MSEARVTKTAVARQRRYAVVMAGGVGTRFWPWSRARLPKQMLPLGGRRSMLAETVARLRGVVDLERILVVTSRRIARQVRAELAGMPPANVLCEPVGRNTAPCIGWAAREILRRDPSGVMIVLPSDHVVAPRKSFAADVIRGLTVADRRRMLVTFGIRPTYPATGYGYVRAVQPLDGEPGVLLVERFCEKPQLNRAKRFLASGGYYWNSGMFAWRADVVLDEIKRHLPRLAAGLERLERTRRRGRLPAEALERHFPRLPSVSIDYGVMEKTDRVALIPASFAWNDIGSWAAVADLWPADGQGNRTRDPLVAVDSKDNVVATRGKPVALVGVKGLAVVDAGDALLVCRREQAERVREVVAELERRGWSRLL